MINWEDDGLLPARIWGFLNLQHLPQDNRIEFGGLDPVVPGIYAIIESAGWVKERRWGITSEISALADLDVGQMVNDRVTKLQFYLADVQSFNQPLAVVPDIGGPVNRYIILKDREAWSEDFSKWLARDYETFPDFDEDVDPEDLVPEEEYEVDEEDADI